MLEINLKNLIQNVNHIRDVSNKKLIGVVKNNAYGNGAVAISQALIANGVDFLLVNDISETVDLLNHQIQVPILIHNSISDDDFDWIQRHNQLRITINSIDDCHRAIKHQLQSRLTVHIQIDTKMNRLGLKSLDELDTVITLLQAHPQIDIEGIYTHFVDVQHSEAQVERFKPFANRYPFKMIHCAASATYDSIDFGNYVRVGLHLYDVNQVMSVVCQPLAIRDIKKNETVGYLGAYTAQQDMRLALLPIGYGNGYRRRLEGFYVYANHQTYPIIGRICMNHIFVAIDETVDLNTRFELTSSNLPAKALAEYTGCSNYEIYTMFIFNTVRYVS